MKEGWKTQRLNDACIINYGTRVVKKKDGGSIYPVYGGGGATFKMDTYNRENCLVVSRFAMSEKCTRFVEGKFFLNDSGLTVGVNDSALSQPFLNWILFFKNDEIYSFGKGSAQKNLDMDDFRNMLISYPLSLSEQQRIVSILESEFEKIDRLRSNAELNFRHAKALFNAATEKELKDNGALSVRMDEICDITSSLVNPQEGQYQNLLHVGGGNIESETGRLFDLKTANEEKLISGKFLFDETMVLYNKIRPYLKKVAKPDFKGLCSADMYPLKPKDICNREYLYYILLSKDFTDYAILGSARAGMPKVNREHLFAYTCKIPSIDIQKQIVATLDELDAKCKVIQDNYTKTIALCDDLKQALLRKAFNGEL